MDDAHEAELRRIIENRRKRGSLKSTTSDLFDDGTARQPRQLVLPNRPPTSDAASATLPASPPGTVAVQSSASWRQTLSDATQTTSHTFSNTATGNDGVLQRPPGPSITPRQAAVQSRVSFLNPGGADDRKLRDSQALQEKKVDQLQDELRSGLSEIRRALNTVIQEQRHGPPPAPVPLAYADSPKAGGGDSRNFIQSKYSSMHQTTTTTTNVDHNYGDVAGGSEQQHRQGGASSLQHLVSSPRVGMAAAPTLQPTSSNVINGAASTSNLRYRSGQPFTLKSTVPLLDTSIIPGRSLGPPVDSSTRYHDELRRQSSAAHMLPKHAPYARHEAPQPQAATPTTPHASSRHSYSTPVAAPVNQSRPYQPPANIRPFSKTTIDLQSSLTILSEGEWWYKWDSTGEKVKLRWVWMDHSRRALSWSDKQLRETPMFGPRIPMEEIQRVMTTQITETDPHGNPRIFYVLLIECASRLLQLGTERRDKLDLWYEALTNLIVSTKQAMHSRVAASMGSD